MSEQEVTDFVDKYAAIAEFLNKFKDSEVTYTERSIGLARFFKWLRVVKGLELSPSQFLDQHLEKRVSASVEERRWALKLVLEFSRDNPDLQGNAVNSRYGAFFLPLKSFCDYNEAPLTQNKGFFPKRNRRKYTEKPFTAEYIKRILSVLPQRERAICMCELQSGQSIKQVLVDVNQMARYIFREIDVGKQRIRLDFSERKGNGFPYFSYISVDAIQEIQKWRAIRAQILNGKESEWLFITDKGEPLPRKFFHNNLRWTFNQHKLRTGPLSIRSHGFRKFFEQEASPPERGISKAYISFMMGHSTGNGTNHKLDIVGGVYDNAPRTYPDVVEKEYAKLEPYLNIYSGKLGGSTLHFTEEQQALLGLMIQKFREEKVKID